MERADAVDSILRRRCYQQYRSYWGYRNFASNDTSTNIAPWGILIGGEELHNNHHAYVASAKLSNKWWEFDIGWLYIRILEILGLATVRKVAPKVRFNLTKTCCRDIATLQAVIIHRYDVLAKYAKYLKQTAVAEIRNLQSREIFGQQDSHALDAVKHWLQRNVDELTKTGRSGAGTSFQQNINDHLHDAARIDRSVEPFYSI